MKNLILLILTAISLSCHRDKPTGLEVHLINQTDFFIELKYKNESNQEISHQILEKSMLTIIGGTCCCLPANKICQFPWEPGDSVFLIFSDSLITIYKGVPINKNEKSLSAIDFWASNGYSRSFVDEKYIYTYIINEEDYLAAVPIED